MLRANSLKNLLIKNARITFLGSNQATRGVAHLSFILPLSRQVALLRRTAKAHPNTLELDSFIAGLSPYFKKVVCTDYRYSGKAINADTIIGFGTSLNTELANSRQQIYYATGAASNFQTERVLDEVCFLRSIGGQVDLGYFRFPEALSSVGERLSNSIYSIGNDHTASTFHPSLNIRKLPGIALNRHQFQINSAKLATSKSAILWIGSKGILHKGLHIAAEVAARTGLHLICIGIRAEEMPLAKSILKSTDASHELHSYIDIASPEWLKMCSRSICVLGCSVSEGMSTSLLTAASYGVQPISTDTCGIDLGIVIPFKDRSTLVDRLSNEVDISKSRSPARIISEAQDLIGFISANHTATAFQDQLSSHLTHDLSK